MIIGRQMLILGSFLSSGCTFHEVLEEHRQRVALSTENVEGRIDRFKKAATNGQVRLEAQSVNKPWVAGKSIPVAREVLLPKALQRRVESTLLFGSTAFDLPAIAQRLSIAIDLPVRISPEALLPSSMFAPRTSLNVPGEIVLMPSEAAFPRGSQPLAKILDVIARRLNIYWRYESGAIIFYRTQTQVFDVRLLTTSASVEMALGRSSAAGAGGFDSSARTVLRSTEQSALDAIKVKVEPFLTKAGVVTAQSGASSSIVVTDVPESLSNIAQFIEKENRILTRRLRLVFEELTVETENDQELRVDWSAAVMTDHLTASVKGPITASEDDLSTSAVAVAAPGSNPIQLMLQALSRQGKVIRHSTIPMMTINRRPVTHAVRTTFSYIDQIKTTPATAIKSDGSEPQNGSVSVSQKEETVGAFLTILPDAQEDGQILISIAYDNTVAQPLKTVSFGGSGKNLSVQQIVIDGNGSVQQIALRSGQSRLISGFERTKEQSKSLSLSPELPAILGGSDRIGKSKLITVIVLTALLEDG